MQRLFTRLFDLYLVKEEAVILQQFAAIMSETVSPATAGVVTGPAEAPESSASFPLVIEGAESGAVVVTGYTMEQLGPARAAILAAATEVLGDIVGRCRAWQRLTSEHRLLRALIAPPGAGSSEAAERFRLAFDASPDPVALSTYDTGVFLDINPAFSRMMGYTREEVIGRRSVDLGVWTDLATRVRIVERLRKQGGFVEEEIVYRRKDGSPVTCLAYGQMLELPEGLFVLTFAHDLTARRALEERLREAERLESVGRLAGGVAHEFNNIATVILGNAALLADRLKQQGETARELDGILRAARRAAFVTRRLLAYSGRQTLKPAAADLNDLIRELIPDIRELTGPGIKIRLRRGRKVPPAYVDGDQVREVVTELVRNAAAAMPSGGVLTIGTEEASLTEPEPDAARGRYAVLIVSDTGIGMPESTRASLFDPFFSARGNLAEASGLGLAVVYGTVRQSGGFIRVASTPGKGTEFRIFLPAAAAQAGPASA